MATLNTTANLTQITAPRVPLTDERTGLISREWYRFFLSLYNLTGNGQNNTSLTDLQVGPPSAQQEDLTDLVINIEALQTLPNQEPALGQIAELQKQIEGLATAIGRTCDEVTAELQKQIDALNLLPLPSGTVTNVAALTLGTVGTNLSSTVATGTTTPVITLNVPTASAANRGALSSDDWTTFNNKQAVKSPVTQTADFTVAAVDLWLINNKSGSGCVVTLPVPASSIGRVLYLQNYQNQTLVSASANVIPLVGGAASTAILAATAGAHATLVCNGTNWVITQYQ